MKHSVNEQTDAAIPQSTVKGNPRRRSRGAQRQIDEGGYTAKDVGMLVAENIPGVGEAILARDIVTDASKGDYASAALGTAALGIGILPGGDILNKPIKAAAKKLRKQDNEAATKLMTDKGAAEEWKETNKLPESQRQKRVPEVQKAAIDLSEGKITSQEYRRAVTANQPIQPITKNNFPDMPTKTEIVGALKATDPRKVDTGIIGLNKDIPTGTRVGSRLDIPSYDNYDKWIVSLHDGEVRNGKAIGYGQTAVLKDVEFISSAKGGLGIAKGKGKTTIARIHGDYQNAEPENVFEAAKQLIDDPEWTQVGMNPFRHSYFYDKATGSPVTKADEVIQVGPLVLAKGVKKPTLSEMKELVGGTKVIKDGKITYKGAVRTDDGKIRTFNEGGMALENQMEMFEDGGLMDEGGTVDPVSGNDVPPGSTQEEVRDDIPAQLSEGEFVMPADVVRYHGLDKMMQLRQEAKMGLKIMEEMGQMGNSEEATIADDLPFNFEDLELDDEPREMQVGGYIAPNMPMQTQQSSFANYTPQYNVPQQNQFTPYTPPVQQAVPTAPTMNTLPTFDKFVPPAGQPRKYINPETGAILMIPVDGQGNLMYPPPAGFILFSEYEANQSQTPDPAITPVQQQQQNETDGGTPEVDAYNAQQAELMKKRKDAAKDLGYTKEQSLGQAVMSFLTKGMVGQEQERGTIMQDGTIADGDGNYFDPLSGEQRGFLGTTNRGKGDLKVTQEMYDLGVTPASLAGLRNMIGEDSIKDLLKKSVDEPLPKNIGAGGTDGSYFADLSQKTAPAKPAVRETVDRDIFTSDDVKVDTTLGQTSTLSDTEQTLRDASVGDIAEYFAGDQAQEILAFMDKDGQLSNKQKLEYITILADKGAGQVNFPTSNNILPNNVDFSKFSPEARNAAKTVVASIESEGSDDLKSQLATTRKKISADLVAANLRAATPTTATSSSREQRIGGRGDDMPMSARIEASKQAAQSKLDAAKKADKKQYSRDLRGSKYDATFEQLDKARRDDNIQRNSKPNRVGVNLSEKVGKENAAKIEDRQGTATNVDQKGNISYDNSHDWSKSTQTNVNRTTSSKAQAIQEDRDEGGTGKIVCTEMYRQTQLDDWKQAIRIWGVHQKKYLTPYHEIFGVRLFIPLRILPEG